MRCNLLATCVTAGLLTVLLPNALAQWTTQTIALRPGWNAVFLEVQPEPRESGAVLAGLPVESVWRYNKRSSTLQFIRDPNELLQEPEAWLIWAPPHHELASHFSLYAIEGGLPYLIKTTNTTSFQWTLRGRPVRRQINWLPDSLNLVGFGLPTSAAPRFDTFFAGEPALGDFTLFRLDPQGRWVPTSGSALMQPGEAFWIRARGLPAFQGPIQVQLDRRVGLDFGRILTEQKLRLYNASPSARTIAVRLLPSHSPPDGNGTAIAGDVPLSVWQNDFAGGRVGWTNFPAVLQSNVPPRATWELRLEVRRRDMFAYVPPLGVTNALYQSLLEVTDTAGLSRQVVPVMAEGIETAAIRGASSVLYRAPVAAQSHPRAGLWIGSATINSVSHPPDPTPVKAAGEFAFKLLVHLDAAGEARLLQKVVQVWLPGTYRWADDGSGHLVADQPGRFVLLTDDSLMTRYTGAAMQDSQPVARRYSSAAFAFQDPILMSAQGEFGSNGGVLSASIPLPFDDRLNPFVHAHHPDHNNLDDRQQPLPTKVVRGLAETRESWSIRRDLSLQFTADDPEQLSQSLSGWGDTQLGGIYEETITGLHKMPLVLRGTFRLHRASPTPVLNQ